MSTSVQSRKIDWGKVTRTYRAGWLPLAGIAVSTILLFVAVILLVLGSAAFSAGSTEGRAVGATSSAIAWSVLMFGSGLFVGSLAGWLAVLIGTKGTEQVS